MGPEVMEMMRVGRFFWVLGTAAFFVAAPSTAGSVKAPARPARESSRWAGHHRLYSTSSLFGALEVTEAGGIRYLFVDGILQTAMYPDPAKVAGECHLFTRRYWLELLPYFRPGVRRCLLIGLGGGLLPAVLEGYGVRTHGVEVDPKVVDVARRYFSYQQPATISDGRNYLAREAEKFDFIVIDAFAGASIPYHLLTRQCFQLAARRLERSGILALNLISRPSNSRVSASVVQTLSQVFPHVAVYRTGSSDCVQSLICFASGAPLKPSLHPHGAGLGVTAEELMRTGLYLVRPRSPDSIELTDGKNPLAGEWEREAKEWRANCVVAMAMNQGPGEANGPDWRKARPSTARNGVTNFTRLADKLCVARTPGRWWIGTLGGLVELDEESFHVRRVHTPAEGLVGTRVLNIAADGDILWVGTTAGISRLDTETGDILNIPALTYRRGFEFEKGQGYIWALSNDSAVCCESSSGRYRRFPLGDGIGEVVREGTTLWGAGDGHIIRLDTATGRKMAGEWSIPGPAATRLQRLFLGPREIWALAGEDSPRGCRLLRVDKETLRADLQGRAAGLMHDGVQELMVVGDDVWLRTTGEWDERTHTGMGGQLYRYRRASGRWEAISSISGSRHDEPTCLARLDGDLWVATRAYDHTEEMVVAWGMVPLKREAPVVKTLALNCFSPGEGTWKTYFVPAATNYDRIISMTRYEGCLWFLLERRPLAASWDELRSRANKQCVVPGYVDLGSPQPKAVLMEQPELLPVWDRRIRGRKAIDLFVRGRLLWLQRITHGGGQLWQRTGGGKWREVELDGSLTNPGEVRLFTVGERVFASCAAGALQFEPQGNRWLPWSVVRRWSVTDLLKDRRGTWWMAATMKRISLPVDSERNDDDRKPLQGGLFRSQNGSSWAVPDIAPWTWHQQDVAGEVRFLPLEQVKRIPGDLDLWGQTASSFPRRGARRVRQEKTGAGVSCVQSDGERLWAGTFGEGVFCLENKRWRRLWPRSNIPSETGRWFVPRAAGDTVTSMALSGDSLWIATVAGLRRHHIPDGAVESVDNSTVGLGTLIKLHDTTDLGYIQKTGPTVCASGRYVWFWPGGSNQGLYRFDEKTQLWKRMLTDIQPRCLDCRDNLTLWVGTPGGLLRLDRVTRRRRMFTTLEGLPGDSVESLVLDGHSIWIGTSSGIARFDRAIFEKR